jgi:hypothetical protein
MDSKGGHKGFKDRRAMIDQMFQPSNAKTSLLTVVEDSGKYTFNKQSEQEKIKSRKEAIRKSQYNKEWDNEMRSKFDIVQHASTVKMFLKYGKKIMRDTEIQVRINDSNIRL